MVDTVVEGPQRALEADTNEQGRTRASSGRAEREKKRTIAATCRRRMPPRARGTRRRRSARGRARTRPRRAARSRPRPSARSSSTIAVRSPDRPGWRFAVSKILTASPPIDVGRICPAVYETKYARVSQPEAVDDPLGGEQPLPAECHRQRRHDHDRDSEREPPQVGRRENIPRLLDVDLEQDVARPRASSARPRSAIRNGRLTRDNRGTRVRDPARSCR